MRSNPRPDDADKGEHGPSTKIFSVRLLHQKGYNLRKSMTVLWILWSQTYTAPGNNETSRHPSDYNRIPVTWNPSTSSVAKRATLPPITVKGEGSHWESNVRRLRPPKHSHKQIL